MPQANSQRPSRRPVFFIALFAISATIVSILHLTDAIDPGTAFLLFLASMGFMALSVIATVRAKGAARASLAIRRYGVGMLIASLGYVLGLGLAVTLSQRNELDGGGAFATALLPVIPIFYMIYVMGRYLAEETDEYLRHRATMASMVGLACVLGFGSFWGFMEGFRIVPHLPGWWTMPVWALSMGLAQGWMSLRNRMESDA